MHNTDGPLYSPAKRTGWPWWVWAVLSPFIGFALLMLYFMVKPQTPEDRAMAAARSSISLCWEDQKRPSLSPGSARSVAGICETMDRDFQAKYRRKP